jgi:hypothetical protein
MSLLPADPVTLLNLGFVVLILELRDSLGVLGILTENFLTPRPRQRSVFDGTNYFIRSPQAAKKTRKLTKKTILAKVQIY